MYETVLTVTIQKNTRGNLYARILWVPTIPFGRIFAICRSFRQSFLVGFNLLVYRGVRQNHLSILPPPPPQIH